MGDLRRITVVVNDARAVIEVAGDAPRLLVQRLTDILPYATDLHYAKISGQSVLFLVPFFVPPQAAVHVSRLARGTVAYWPNRQQVLFYYGAFEKEDATVLIVGRLVEGLEGVATVGEALRLGTPAWVRLEAGC
jgi:hypothetical protein